MNLSLRTLRRCMVCGSNEVRSDEVVDRGILLLSECPRCEHRWTERPAVRVTTRAVAAPVSVAASARMAPASEEQATAA